jgi:hypothetical protein
VTEVVLATERDVSFWEVELKKNRKKPPIDKGIDFLLQLL